MVVVTGVSGPPLEQTSGIPEAMPDQTADVLPWRTDDLAALADPRLSRLLRHHAVALAETGAQPLKRDLLMFIVHHPLDNQCRQHIEGYKAVLRDPAVVVPVTMTMVGMALRSAIGGDGQYDRWRLDLEDRFLKVR